MSNDPAAPLQRLSPISRTGRKSTKRGKSGPVWPPVLEEALLEGLAEYRPASGRELAHLKRCPKRNQFISDYILRKTGEERTAKQVGSRLQQMRETSNDPEILRLIVKSSPLCPKSPIHKRTRSRRPSPPAYAPTSHRDLPPFDALPPPSKSPIPVLPLEAETPTPWMLHDQELFYGNQGTSSEFTLYLDQYASMDFCYTEQESYPSVIEAPALASSYEWDGYAGTDGRSPSLVSPLETKISEPWMLHDQELFYGYQGTSSEFTLDLDKYAPMDSCYTEQESYPSVIDAPASGYEWDGYAETDAAGLSLDLPDPSFWESFELGHHDGACKVCGEVWCSCGFE